MARAKNALRRHVVAFVAVVIIYLASPHDANLVCWALQSIYLYNVMDVIAPLLTLTKKRANLEIEILPRTTSILEADNRFALTVPNRKFVIGNRKSPRNEIIKGSKKGRYNSSSN